MLPGEDVPAIAGFGSFVVFLKNVMMGAVVKVSVMEADGADTFPTASVTTAVIIFSPRIRPCD
jgi:hypothetical protein